MEELNLTETELRYFGDLFLCCDEESNGKIPVLKATELFRSSNISNEALKQITDLSFPHNTTIGVSHINRKQFYSALKLIAAHQAKLSIVSELLTKSVELPLPRFTWNLNFESNPDLIQLSNSPKEQHIHKRDRLFCNVGSYEPMRLSSNSSDVDIPQTVLQHDSTEGISTDSEVESETISQRSDASHSIRLKNGSPWSTASESPTPTNSVAEQRASGLAGPAGIQRSGVWANSATGRGVWPVSVGEEHTQLLGTEEESSDRHSSDEDTVGENSFWLIGPEQRRHYESQFAQLQPDGRGMLKGHTVKLFFEKSRLPVDDLRKIWKLSDVTCDGALDIEEFSTAMHLIVLRRNKVPVPDTLPTCLVPVPRNQSPEQAVATDLVDLSSDMFNSGTSADFNLIPQPAGLILESDVYDGNTLKKLTIEDSPSSLSPANDARQKMENQAPSKEWTKFVDSPTSSISSPGPKPVNFDFHKSAVERDPKIYHPVALRVTPESNVLPVHGDVDITNSTSPRRIDDIFDRPHDVSSPKKLNSQSSGDGTTHTDIKPIQRPQAKKPVLKTVGILPPPPAKETPLPQEEIGLMSLQYPPKKDPPPPPPPRPLRTHTRSSSLDLNRFKGTQGCIVGVPPQVPPRVSPSIASPSSKKLINQRSEGDVLGLLTEPSFGPPNLFSPDVNESEGESFANFAHFQNDSKAEQPVSLPRSRASFEDTDPSGPPKKHGAFEVYRKPTPRTSESPDGINTSLDPNKTEDSLKRLQEQNSLLSRLCQELSLELADVQRERETLRLKLESTSTAV